MPLVAHCDSDGLAFRVPGDVAPSDVVPTQPRAPGLARVRVSVTGASVHARRSRGEQSADGMRRHGARMTWDPSGHGRVWSGQV
jgi:hypothetical protein